MLRCLPLLLFIGCVDPVPDVSAATPRPVASIPPTAETCAAYTYEGETYDCTFVDRCDNHVSNLPYRLACCECDEELCLADPSCPVPSDRS